MIPPFPAIYYLSPTAAVEASYLLHSVDLHVASSKEKPRWSSTVVSARAVAYCSRSRWRASVLPREAATQNGSYRYTSPGAIAAGLE